MDILEQIKTILKGKDKMKIIGLSVLVVLCFVLVYAASSPFSIDTGDYSNGAKENLVCSDFAEVLSSVEGAGRVKVYTTYIDEDKLEVQGVIIVAEGANDLDIKIKLQQAAATAYGISIDRIEVFQMKGVN